MIIFKVIYKNGIFRQHNNIQEENNLTQFVYKKNIMAMKLLIVPHEIKKKTESIVVKHYYHQLLFFLIHQFQFTPQVIVLLYNYRADIFFGNMINLFKCM